MATRSDRLEGLMRGGQLKKPPPPPPPPPPPITMTDYNLPSGYKITINENGLDSVKFNGVTLCSGGTQQIDGYPFYHSDRLLSPMPTIGSKSVSFTSTGAVVTHTYSSVISSTAVFTYTVSGNDVKVSVLVTNNGSTPITNPAFRSPFFLFDDYNAVKASSNGLAYDQNHTRNSGELLSYPATNVPYAATYLSSTAAGGVPIHMCTWSEGDPFDKFMTLSVGVFQVPGTALGNFFFNSVPVHGSREFKFAYRFATPDWKDLLGGYRTKLRAVFPNIAYEPDARPLVYFAAIDQSYIRPDNPYGYGDSGDANCIGSGLCRRLDKPVGVQNFLSLLVGPMLDTGYQGLVMWQPQGIHPRGIQYRPDFDVFNPDTLANLPTLTSGFRNAGLNIGLLSRPGITVTSSTWTTDSSTRLTDYVDSFGDLKYRLQWALSNNFNAFYLDSFIQDGPDHNILKMIRDVIGSNVHTFCEFSTALSLAYSAAYMQVHWNNGIVWDQRQQILRWLWPESIIAGNFVGNPPVGYSQLYTAMFDLKISPLVEDYRATPIGTENAILKPLVASRIGPNHRWL